MIALADSVPRRGGLVTIVLPAKDEEEGIQRTLRALPIETLAAMGLRAEVVVLDGNSQDRTADVARRWGAIVIPDPAPGKGRAFRHAVDRFRGDWVVMLDADGSYAADALPRLLRPLLEDDADVVMGHRLLQRRSMSGAHLVGNVLLSLLASALYNRLCLDLCTGLWGFRREALAKLPLESRGFDLEADLFSLSSRFGLRIKEVRVDYLPRDGEPNLHFGTDGLEILHRLVHNRFTPLDVLREAARQGPEETGTGERGAVKLSEVHA